MSRYSAWKNRLSHWSKMFAGTSYYHQPQGMGQMFVPAQLKGYFNDLTGKANWRGRTDKEGIAYNVLTNGNPVYFPIMLAQKGLAHWDFWLQHNNSEHKTNFLKIANWLHQNQDLKGGWDTWGPMGQPIQFRYSAMAQGQALSVMSRAYQMNCEAKYEQACRQAMTLMRRPVQDGGVSWYEGDSIFLEEFPGPNRDTVLNGWVFAIFGIYDFLIAFKDAETLAFYEKSQATLIRCLSEFDAGYWSYYSSGTKRIASPFYHALHISQLEALSMISGVEAVEASRKKWKNYASHSSYRTYALLRKGIQKLTEPIEVSIAE